MRRQRLSRRCERVITESNHLGCVATVIRRLLVGPSAESDASEINEALARYRENLQDVGLRMVSGWLRERCHQRSDGDPVVPMMPLSLSVRIVNGLQEVSCYNNAKTRAACILVAMFYRWMSDQCDAWRAEIVAQELLTSMAISDSPSPGSGGAAVSSASKAGKKKKKKGADGPASSPSKVTPKPEKAVQAPLLADKAPDLPSASTDSGTAQTIGLDEASRAATCQDSLEDSSVNMGEMPVENGNEIYSKPVDEVPSANGHRGVVLSESVASNSNDAAQERVRSALNERGADGTSLVENAIALDAFVSIGVDFESSFEPAEDFLVGRLLSILKHTA